MGRLPLVLILVLSLTLAIAVPTFASGGGSEDRGGPPDNPRNPNDPGPQTIYFVDYAHPAPFQGEPFGDQVGLYEIIRIGPFRARLDPPAGGVPYQINDTSVPGLDVPDTRDAIKAGFETWDDAANEALFDDNPGVNTDDFDDSLCVGVDDGDNTVFWDDLSLTFFFDALAVSCVRLQFSSGVLEVTEFDIVFNTNGVIWEVCPPGGCEGLGTFDVQNIATHEAGHSLFLGDLSQFQTGELTMYGFASPGELKKRTLGHGDELGLRHLYGP